MSSLRHALLVLALVIPATQAQADPVHQSKTRLPWEVGTAKAPPPLQSDAFVANFVLKAAYRDCGSMEGGKNPGPRDIAGFEPKAAGSFPVFIFVTGTLMKFNGPEAQLLTREMAKRGFVSAAVDYDNSAYPYCPAMNAKAKCIFDGASKTSAVSQVCAREKADCSKGIVVSGFSQGANLAALSRNHDERVRAAYLMGHGDRALNGLDVSRCADDATTLLTPSQMRSVSGEADLFFGAATAGVRKQLQKVVGVQCPDATHCEQADGSGWFIVGNKELRDGTADHCYFLNKANTYCSSYDGLDPIWEKGNQPWSIAPNLDWLASQIAAPPTLTKTSK
jgi:dienelactone hydrolase